MNHFILCASDCEHYNGTTEPALSIAQDRLIQKKWPIYPKTRNRKSFQVGDKCLVYIGGLKNLGGFLIGEFEIQSIDENKRKEPVDNVDLYTGIPDKLLIIRDYKVYQKPREAKPILKKMPFFPKNEKKWGVILIGGCRKVTKDQYLLLSGIQ